MLIHVSVPGDTDTGIHYLNKMLLRGHVGTFTHSKYQYADILGLGVGTDEASLG
jgi:hypothetical protein